MKPTIFLADDSPTERRIIADALGDSCEVTSFHSAAALLESLMTGALPDVLVVDWQMPGTTGIDVCHFVRGNPRTTHLPVLVLTGHRSSEHMVEALAAGAHDFVAKPFIAAELVARIGSLVRTKRLRERTEQVLAEKGSLATERAHLAELYLGVIGHDLRNPLAAISNAAVLLGQDLSSDKRGSITQRLLGSVRRMTGMLDEILDVTRARLGGGLQVQPAPRDIAEMCRQVTQELELANEGRTVSFESTGDLNGTFDYDRMSQALSNVVSNALQHGAQDTPVDVRATSTIDRIVLEVHNSGPSISPERMKVIFDPFARGKSAGMPSQGLGLGLYITDQIVRAHGGTTAVTSNGGTTFTITLPRFSPDA